MPRYFILPHVYVCRTTEHVVLLDVREDAYLACRLNDSQSWCAVVEGWPCGHDPQIHRDAPAEALDDLEEQLGHLLTTDAAAGKSAAPVEAEHAPLPLVEPSLDARPDVSRGFFLRLTLAFVTTWFVLRCRSLRAALARVRRHRAAVAGRPNAQPVEAAQWVVSAFLYLKPFYFKGRADCLIESLTLLELLSAHGIVANLCVGVDTEPFAAHAWVQGDGRVFNDTPERIRRFVPILVV